MRTCLQRAFLRSSVVAVVVVLGAGAELNARPLDSAITKADVDLKASQSWQDGKAKAVDPELLWDVLGLGAKSVERAWSAGGIAPQAPPASLRYVVAFKRPIAVGSVFVQASGGRLGVLKADAKFPPDVKDESAWIFQRPADHQAGAVVFTLSAGTSTRALLLVDDRKGGDSSLRGLTLFKERWQNVTPAALAYAGHEYTIPESPNTYFASHVTEGSGNWISSGVDVKGQVSTPAITDVNPEWFMLTWNQPRQIGGLWLEGNLSELTIDSYAGPDSVNPRVGTPREWRRVKKLTQHADRGRWIIFDEPVSTRGLRLNILSTERTPRIATIHALHVLAKATGRPTTDVAAGGEAAGSAGADQPPFHFPYQLGAGGNMTLVVNDATGKRARNLLTRELLDGGAHQQAWDLKDEEGKFVGVGEYQWRAISWPQLQTKYEFTVYPNVSQNSPGNAPWLTGASGPGGWMADHTPPSSVCATGDRVYLGSEVAESGVSLIECDLTGKKLWGQPSFGAWTGPRRMAADGKTLYVASPILNERADNVWTVDIASKEIRTLMSLPPTALRNRGMTGLAVHGGKLAMSVAAPAHLLVNAAVADDVDLAASYPLQREERRPRFNGEIVPKPKRDFLRLFRLMESPPGMDVDGSLVWLQSLRSSLPRQHIVLAFNRPIPLGSVAFPAPDAKDVHVEVSLLKPDAAYPPNVDDARQWTVFANQSGEAWSVLPAPENTLTRALRITFVKGGPKDDFLGPSAEQGNTPDIDGSLDSEPGAKPSLVEFGNNREGWLGRLEGMKLLRCRFRSVLPGSTIRVNSGKVDPSGEWDAQRDEPLSEANPGIYAIEWPTARKVHGLAIKEIDGKTTKIDVYTGSDSGPIDIASADGWETVGEHQPLRRNHHTGFYRDNHAARYLDDYVDFGRDISTRAVRLRVVAQWEDNGGLVEEGMRRDLGGLTIDPRRCRVFGVAPVEYLGGEPSLDPLSNQRIEIYNAASAKLEQELPIDQPGQIAFHPQGELFAISSSKIVQIDRHGSPHRPFVTDLEKPVDLAFDAGGHMYVFDAGADRQNVRVYDAKGKLVRSIGKPGGVRTGAWDRERMATASDIDVDSAGQLWVVEPSMPKRITLWSTEGEFKTEFLGNTPYGGGGVLDPYDKSRLFFGPLEFQLDWKTGRSRLKNLLWQGATSSGEVPIRIGEHTYLVTRPEVSSTMPCGIVYLYEKDHLKLAAAMGSASKFPALKRPELLARLGGTPLKDQKFTWSDLNGNGEVDFEEVVFSRLDDLGGLTNFNRDLGIQAGTCRFEVKQFLPSGVPIYQQRQFPELKGRILYRLDDGNFYRMGDDPWMKEALLAPDGKELWTYPQEGSGVRNLRTFGPWKRGQIVSQFGIAGHETAPAGDLGEFVILHANMGAWNIWTHDGLLVGPLFRDLRDPKVRPWSMTAHDRGMPLTDVTPGEEHFAAYLCLSQQDNKYYAVAGHNHISVLEVLGLDQFERTSGKFNISSEALRKTQDWTERHEQQTIYERAPVVDCYRLTMAPTIDGKLDEWEDASADIDKSAELFMGYDDSHLYLAYKASNLGPLKNTGQQWDRAFKTGACVDLQIGTDPAAPEDRTAPEAGDVRLLMTYLRDKPTAILYRPVAPGAPAQQKWRVVSPVAEATFDSVVQLRDVKMARAELPYGYIVEAAVPLATLGLDPSAGQRFKFDWGVLVAGPDGHEVLRRLYWANKATSSVSDAPTEARIHPNLWGHVRFLDRDQKSSETRLDSVEINPRTGKKGKDLAKDVDDILETLEDDKK